MARSCRRGLREGARRHRARREAPSRKYQAQRRGDESRRGGDPHNAHEDDSTVDRLPILSNERFRRLPVVDTGSRIKMVFTRADFVSYTGPDLMCQSRQFVKAAASQDFHRILIGGGVTPYTLLMIIASGVAI